MPSALSAKNHPGGRTQILNVRRIRRTNRHPVESDEDSAPESISDTEDWLNWNGDLHNPNDSVDDCAADFESDIEQDNSIWDPEWPKQWDMSAVPNDPGFIRPTQKSQRKAEKVLVIVNAIETRRNKGVRNKYDRMHQCFTSFFMYLDQEFYLEIYHERMVSSSLWISVDKQMYSRRNEAFGKIHRFWSYESKQCKNVTALSFPTGPCLNRSERLPICSNNDKNNYRSQQMLDGQYIKLSVNRASTICGFESTVIKQWYGCCYA